MLSKLIKKIYKPTNRFFIVTMRLSKDTNMNLFILLLLVLSLIIIFPIFKQILSAIILTIIVYPLYNLINKKLKIKWLSSLIIIVLVVALTIIVFYIIGKFLTMEAYKLFYSKGNFNTYFNLPLIQKIPFYKEIYSQIIGSFDNIKSWIFQRITSFVTSIPHVFFNYFLILAITFFLLIDAPKAIKALTNLKLFKKAHYDFLIKEIWDITYGIVYGQILVAMIQGLVGGIGIFFGSLIFNVHDASPIIWGVLMAISALLPIVGTGLIWAPLGLFRIYEGIALNQPNLIWFGIFILIWGATIVSNIDGLIRPFFISSKIKVHPIIVLIGAIGGVMQLGFVGIFIGPIILGLFVKSLDIFMKINKEGVK